jgi:phosphate:Na+ symporter
VGLGVTAALQSSTATALMMTSFAGAGVADLVVALAVMLGANVGTTLIVQVFSFDMQVVFPLFIAAGVFALRRGRGTRYQDVGRIARRKPAPRESRRTSIPLSTWRWRWSSWEFSRGWLRC